MLSRKEGEKAKVIIRNIFFFCCCLLPMMFVVIGTQNIKRANRVPLYSDPLVKPRWKQKFKEKKTENRTNIYRSATSTEPYAQPSRGHVAQLNSTAAATTAASQHPTRTKLAGRWWCANTTFDWLMYISACAPHIRAPPSLPLFVAHPRHQCAMG